MRRAAPIAGVAVGLLLVGVMVLLLHGIAAASGCSARGRLRGLPMKRALVVYARFLIVVYDRAGWKTWAAGAYRVVERWDA